jgi:hypothetical protein
MCVQIAGGAGAVAIYGVTLRNIYCEGHQQGFNMQDGFYNVLIEDNVINLSGTPATAMYESGPEHGMYFESRDNPTSEVTFRRNIIYNVGFNGIHYNGRSTNTVISQNIFYNFSSPAISPQNGGGGMVIRDNLFFNGHSDCIQVSPYSNVNPAPYQVPDYDAASMLIENNTCWSSQQDFAVGGPSRSDYSGFEWTYEGSPRSFKNTVVRNNIIYTHTMSPFRLGNNLNLQYFLFQNNILYRADSGTTVLDYGVTGSNNWGLPLSSSQTPYTIAGLVSLNAANTGNVLADPLFTAQGITNSYVLSPQNFNFKPTVGSPTINAGLTAGAPAFDLWGYQRSGSTPTIGAYEYGGSTLLNACLTPPTVALTTPASAGTVTGSSAILAATASASCGSVSKITFAADSWSYAIDSPVCTSSPCSVVFDSTHLSPGSRKFWASAVDSYGNSAESAQVTATVANTCTTAPGALWISPPASYALTNANYELTASFLWTDINPFCGEVPLSGTGPITGLPANAMFIDAIQVSDWYNPNCFNGEGQEMNCGHQLQPNQYATGNHVFRAYGADSYGNQSFSAPVTFHIDNLPPSDTAAPTGVAITSPSAGPVSGTVTVTATCTDNVACAGMLLLVDGVPVNWTGTFAGGSASMTLITGTLTSGSHTLSVVASDAAANTTTSAGVIVTSPTQSNTAVTWSLSPVVGSITAAGLYTAPASISSSQTLTVKATSVADPTKSATATAALNPPVSVTVAGSGSQAETEALGGW